MNSRELYHHGVLGQKWGVKNGPPYPLGASDHSASERKAGWKKSLDKTAKNESRNSKKSAGNRSTKKITSDSEDSVTAGKRFVGSHSSGRVGDVDPIVAEMAIFAISSISTVGVAQIIKKVNKALQDKEIEHMSRTKEIKSFAEAPKMKTKKPASQSMKEVNPGYPRSGTTMNCSFCTTALALRERGYNVKAAKANDGKYPDRLFKQLFNSETVKMKLKRRDPPEKLLDILAENGDGAYGNLSVYWKAGGGHSIFWKNEKGKTRIYDGQSGEEYTASEYDIKKFLSKVAVRRTTYNRLDNCTPTEYALAVVERADK